MDPWMCMVFGAGAAGWIGWLFYKIRKDRIRDQGYRF